MHVGMLRGHFMHHTTCDVQYIIIEEDRLHVVTNISYYRYVYIWKQQDKEVDQEIDGKMK
jgi:hypothetical protein